MRQYIQQKFVYDGNGFSHKVLWPSLATVTWSLSPKEAREENVNMILSYVDKGVDLTYTIS